MYFSFAQDQMYTQADREDTTYQQQLNDSHTQTVELKADYEWKPTQQSRLEAGYQATLAWGESNGSAYSGQNQEQEAFRFR